MVEVFKTNVNCTEQAQRVLERIHRVFTGYHANFDLSDCDRILRVQSATAPIQSNALLFLLAEQGVIASILPDTVLAAGQGLFVQRIKGG